MKIAELLLKKFDELKNYLIRKSQKFEPTYVESGFCGACCAGNINIVEMLIDKSEKERKNSFTESLTFDFTPKNRFGHTGFHIACENGNTNIVTVVVVDDVSLQFLRASNRKAVHC